jgi:amino acid transporter
MATALIDERIGGALWIIWFVSWVIISFGSSLYFRGNNNVRLKRQFLKWSVIGSGTTFFFLIALSGLPWFILLIFGAFIALIMYLNIRNTILCDACGRTFYNYMWFSKIEYCAKCGAKLPDK